MPLLQGLHVLFAKRIQFLQRECDLCLKEMTDPISNVKIEEREGPRSKPKVKQERMPRANTNFRLDLKQFDWFLDGIDQEKLQLLNQQLETVVRAANEHSSHLQQNKDKTLEIEMDAPLDPVMPQLDEDDVLRADNYQEMLDSQRIELESLQGFVPKRLNQVKFEGFDLHFSSEIEVNDQLGANNKERVTMKMKEQKELLRQLEGRDAHTTIEEGQRGKNARQVKEKPIVAADLFRFSELCPDDQTTADSIGNPFRVGRRPRDNEPKDVKKKKLPSLEELGINLDFAEELQADDIDEDEMVD